MITGDFYIVYKMRELQDTGTHPIILLVFVAVAVLLSIVFGFSNKQDLKLNTAYYACFSFLQFLTFALSLTLRSNAYENYRTLPVFLINIGALLYLAYFAGQLWYSAYLSTHEEHPDNSITYKVFEWMGPLGLFSNWCFIFFLVERMNATVRHESNPRFSRDVISDENYEAIEQSISRYEKKVNASEDLLHPTSPPSRP